MPFLSGETLLAAIPEHDIIVRLTPLKLIVPHIL